jgi:hypothetical protein
MGLFVFFSLVVVSFFMNLLSRFFIWQSDGHKPKYRLTKWNIIYRQKYHDRLGVEVLEHKNKCLLIKWLFKIINEEGVWQELFQNKLARWPSQTRGYHLKYVEI